MLGDAHRDNDVGHRLETHAEAEQRRHGDRPPLHRQLSDARLFRIEFRNSYMNSEGATRADEVRTSACAVRGK